MERKSGPEAADETIVSRTAEIDGVKLHYLTAGRGTPFILLHGYAETSLMWKPIIPVLAERFTVIAPDLPGIGDSDIPADGLDMKSAAIRIHDLAKSLGVEKAQVVGHDIGLMVAYAYAAQFPTEVTKPASVKSVAIYVPGPYREAGFTSRINELRQPPLRRPRSSSHPLAGRV